MRPSSGAKLVGALVGLLLVVAFAALDYLVRPRLPEYFGDNDVYVLVILLALEFLVIWRSIVSVSSDRRRPLSRG